MASTGEEHLPHTIDQYNGVIAHVSFPHNAEDFQSRLSASLTAWREAGRRGIWLKLDVPHAHLIPVALEVCTYTDTMFSGA